MRRALVTGITGMDGSHLADLLLSKGYEVHGLVRRTSAAHPHRLDHLAEEIAAERLVLHQGDVTDQGSLLRAVEASRPDEVYNLAAQSFVGASWKIPVATADVTGVGALRLFEAVLARAPEARVYQASSSEMYGNALQRTHGDMLDERSRFAPRSPYGAAKLFAHTAAINYRESYDTHVSCGILFNHEGPRRGPEFVTRTISLQAAEVALGLRSEITLGNLAARRDWGWAPDYVEAMWLMLQQPLPDDYVIATGVAHSVKDFAEEALATVGRLGDVPIVSTAENARPAELHELVGNAWKAQEALRWRPRVGFSEIVRRMVEADVEMLERRLGREPAPLG